MASDFEAAFRLKAIKYRVENLTREGGKEGGGGRVGERERKCGLWRYDLCAYWSEGERGDGEGTHLSKCRAD